LVAGAGLVVRSLARLSAVDPGFAAEGRTVAVIPLRTGEGSSTPTRESLAAAYDRILAELRARPGTTSVAATTSLPLWGSSPDGSAQIEGTPSATGGPPAVADFRIVSPAYFRTLEIPVRQGREFAETDAPASTYAAVVNEAFVRRYLDGGNAVGRRVRFPGMDWRGDDSWATIVGVAGDTRQDDLVDEPVPAIYYSYRQRPSARPMTVIVLSTAPTAPVLADLRAAIAGVDRGIPFVGRSLTEVVDRSLALPRIRSILLALFAGIALALAAGGIGAVVAFAVAQRTREIGLRIAVGAPAGAITREGVRRAASPVLIGLTVGILGALGLGRLLRGLLFEMAPSDPATLLGAAGFTLGIALLAAYIPARRARRVDPLTALRAE